MTTGPATFHKHVRDTISIHVEHGLVQYFGADGRIEVRTNDEDVFHPLPHVGPRLRAGVLHAERCPDRSKGCRRQFFIEFKGTEPPDCKEWSTDQACRGEAQTAPPVKDLYAGRSQGRGAAPAPTRSSGRASRAGALDPDAPIIGSLNDKLFPPMFTQPGVRKVYEDERVIVWDELMTNGPAIWHKHVRDQLSFHFQHGLVQYFWDDGRIETRMSDEDVFYPLPHVGGLVRAGLLHGERNPDPSKGQRRNFFIEFKGSEPPDCKNWSTDPACK
jgi:hypothetical protein